MSRSVRTILLADLGSVTYRYRGLDDFVRSKAVNSLGVFHIFPSCHLTSSVQPALFELVFYTYTENV